MMSATCRLLRYSDLEPFAVQIIPNQPLFSFFNHVESPWVLEISSLIHKHIYHHLKGLELSSELSSSHPWTNDFKSTSQKIHDLRSQTGPISLAVEYQKTVASVNQEEVTATPSSGPRSVSEAAVSECQVLQSLLSLTRNIIWQHDKENQSTILLPGLMTDFSSQGHLKRKWSHGPVHLY